MDRYGHDPTPDEVADDPVDDAIARLLIKWLLDRQYISGVSSDPNECYIDRAVWPDGEK